MTDRRFATVAGIVVVAAFVGACTAQDRYYSVRSENLRECERRLSEVDRERCRSQLAPASYDEYQRLRRTIPDGKATQAVRRTVEGGRAESKH